MEKSGLAKGHSAVPRFHVRKASAREAAKAYGEKAVMMTVRKPA